MKYENFVNEISEKYGYSEELKIAIDIVISLMIEEYGENNKEDVFNLFRNVRIFSTDNMTINNLKRIENIMIGNINNHIVEEKIDPYDEERDPGSFYSYQTVFDSELNVVDEIKWIVVKDMKNSYNEQAYKKVFGTTINMPYFIHEINHAFAMQKPIYEKNGNEIISKHGMFTEVRSIQDGNKIKDEKTEHIIIEEMVNENITQNMLMKLLNVQEYSEVLQLFKNINHVKTTYSQILISLAQKLEKMLGKDNLLEFRKNNNKKILNEFNILAKQSPIAKKYFDGVEPYEYFSNKCFEIYELNKNMYKISVGDYGQRNKELMVDAFKPLCAYQDVKYNTMSIEKFDEIAKGILQIKVNNNEKQCNINKFSLILL